MNTAIETHHLTKRYRDITAVDELSLHVNRGEIYAFLGLNGAGKTTTIRLLLGMVRPNKGEVVVLDSRIRPGERKPWTSVGYMVETPHAYPELTVRQNLEVMRRLRPNVDAKAVPSIIEQMGLTAYADRRAGTLSHGNAQRLGIAKALLHNPQLLLLDEPTNGLDPAGIVEIRKLLLEMVEQRGVTVFLSSHILGEVSRLAHRIGIIHQGRLLQELDGEELERNRQRRLLVRTHDLVETSKILRQVGCSPEIVDIDHIELSDEASIERPDVVAAQLVNAGHAPTMLQVEEENLEHYFLRLVGMEESVET